MSKATLPLILNNYIRKDKNGDRIFDFELIEPIGDVQDWYEQRMEKWGTRCVGYDLSIGESILDFYTAWTPPIPIIMKLALLHKELIFRLEYYEVGNAFRGIVTARWNGYEVLLEENDWTMTEKDYEELGLL
jgi:hypothetical protein